MIKPNPFLVNARLTNGMYSKMVKNLYVGSNEEPLYIGETAQGLFTMPKSARDILVHAQFTLEPNSDTLKLDVEEFAKMTNKTIQTVYRGLRWLLGNRILQKKKMDTYWVNPFEMFRGDLVKFLEEQYPHTLEEFKQNT